jgi:DNA polymerase-3 subunit delta
MNLQDLQRHIKQEEAAPLYLILGEESYFRDQALDALRQAYQDKNGRDEADQSASDNAPDMFQSDVVYGDETNASEILGLAEEVSFFSSRRRLFVKWADKLSARDGELLLPYFQQPNDATTLVFAAAKLDGRTKWVQALKKQAMVVDCAPLPENQRAGWVTQHARALGLQVEAQALEMLKDQANEGLYAVTRELEKLAAYVPEGQRVQVQDVEHVRGKPPGISVFDWSEAVSRGDHGRALDIVSKNLETGEAPLRMLGAFLWQMRRIWKASGLMLEGMDQTQAARQAGIPPFRAREFMQQVHQWQEPQFRLAWTAFAHADSALKGGRASHPKLILDDLVIQLCKGKKRQAARQR